MSASASALVRESEVKWLMKWIIGIKEKFVTSVG